MKTQKRRGFLAKAGAILAVAALALSASPSYAEDTFTDMPAKSDVVITKLEQPTTPQESSAGLQLDAVPTAGIEGVEFEAYRVPVYIEGNSGDEHTARTSAWQRAIADIELVEAQDLIGGSAAWSGTTGASGQVSWSDAPAGLYLIREAKTPSRVVASGDFLLAVPMTHPTELNTWLETIHVYPKADSQSGGTLKVDNATDYSVGDTVTWTVTAEIPQVRNPINGDFIPTDRFDIVDDLTDAQLILDDTNNGGIRVILPDGAPLVEETHYKVVREPITDESGDRIGETIKIELNEPGREALVKALNDATVDGATPPKYLKVEIDTKVESVGEFDNQVTVYPGNAGSAEDADNSYSIGPATIKYGDVILSKTAEGVTGSDLNGAEFRVYSSSTDAEKKNDNYLTTSTNADGLWTTATVGEDEHGKVRLDGFRYSNFADGEEIAEGHQYWLVEIKAPEGQQLLAEPIAFTIDSFGGEKTIYVNNTANANAFVLPLTGGTGTALLTMLGLGILAIVVFVARARRNADS